MFNLKEAKVKKILNTSVLKTELELEDGSMAIAYPQFVSNIKENDKVVVNTTADDLQLGSGGHHFVLFNLSFRESKQETDGHIMKLRYTPMQFSTLSVESPESEHHKTIMDKLHIEGMPVIIGGLHSHLPAAVATAKYLNPELFITYVMTDGASLPIGLSNSVREHKEKKLIDKTVTCGNSFGGDFEAVNIFSALVCAKYVCKSDLTFISMGPGITGTSTLLGNTELEVGLIINAVNSLKGKAVVVPRLSFKDKRQRHQGISHHTITALSKIALAKSEVTFPRLAKKKRKLVDMQIQKNELDKKHDIFFMENADTDKALAKYGLYPTTMGRSYEEEREFFLACGCAAIKAIGLIKKEK